MELIHEIITKIRSIRSEFRVEPIKKIKAIIHAGKNLSALQEKKQVIMHLARLDTLELKSNGTKIKAAKAALVRDIEIYLPLQGLLDMEKEKERLNKEIENRRKLIVGLSIKLENLSFLKNAPIEVVKRDQQRLHEESSNIKKLEEQLSNM